MLFECGMYNNPKILKKIKEEEERDSSFSHTQRHIHYVLVFNSINYVIDYFVVNIFIYCITQSPTLNLILLYLGRTLAGTTSNNPLYTATMHVIYIYYICCIL